MVPLLNRGALFTSGPDLREAIIISDVRRIGADF